MKVLIPFIILLSYHGYLLRYLLYCVLDWHKVGMVVEPFGFISRLSWLCLCFIHLELGAWMQWFAFFQVFFYDLLIQSHTSYIYVPIKGHNWHFQWSTYKKYSCPDYSLHFSNIDVVPSGFLQFTPQLLKAYISILITVVWGIRRAEGIQARAYSEGGKSGKESGNLSLQWTTLVKNKLPSYFKLKPFAMTSDTWFFSFMWRMVDSLA